jgi:hypothetical protein
VSYRQRKSARTCTKKIKKAHKKSSDSSSNDLKRDRKNLVKNFVKSFRNFLNCVVDEEKVMQIKKFSSLNELECFRMEFENWINNKNYNNSLIIDLIRKPELN